LDPEFGCQYLAGYRFNPADRFPCTERSFGQSVFGTLSPFSPFLVTGLANVPLNDQLAAAAVWAHYLDRWAQRNILRTAAALAAASLFTVGLTQSGN